MPSTNTLLVVGGGLAGARAAEGARAAGFDGRIVLVGDEPTPPYERPPLSKDVLRGQTEPSSTEVHDAAFYADHGIDLLSGESVHDLDVASRRATLTSGGELAFGSVILATGAVPRHLDVPGGTLAGVHYLRTVQDSLRLQETIRHAGRIAVIGAGWIGSEVAASARQMGVEVVLIEPLPVPLVRVLGVEVGGMFAQLHIDHGVAVRLGVGVDQLQGGSSVEKVVLGDGRVEDVDAVVVGIGVVPRVELPRAAGLQLDNGIAVDEYLRASAPHVYAAGDVAAAWHPGYGRRVRVEHWANALNQGTAAGRNAAGAQEPYNRLPYFYSDQYDLGLEYVGFASGDDEIVVRGSLAERRCVVFYHRQGVLKAAMTVNIWDVVEDLKTLVSAGRQMDLRRLADEDNPLTDLLTPVP